MARSTIAFVVSIAILQLIVPATSTVQKPKGLHWDIEPHGSSCWSSDQNGCANQFLDLLEKLKVVMQPSGLVFTLDIPMWFDTTTVTRKSVTRPLSEFVQDIVDVVAIMAYRDWASGARNISTYPSRNGHTDSQEYGCDTEIAYASAHGKKVIILSETDPTVDPPYVTYGDEDTTYLESQQTELKHHYGNQASFDGVGIHWRADWEAMKPTYTLPRTCGNLKDVFEWDSEILVDNDLQTSFFSFTDNHAIRTVYIEVEHLMMTGQTSYISDFLAAAYAHNMAVELLYGNADWTLTANHDYVVKLANLSIAFAKTISTAPYSMNCVNTPGETGETTAVITTSSTSDDSDVSDAAVWFTANVWLYIAVEIVCISVMLM